MCNLYRLHKGPDAIRALFAAQQMPLTFPEGVPNIQPTDVRITDPAPIVRLSEDGNGAEMIMRRWSWPAPGGKPVYNFRSDNREFPAGRCLVLADGFYEFTAPADPKQKRKDRWLFSLPGEEIFGIAGLVRDAPGHGEAFTLLTTTPGPDIQPYHNRQVALLKRSDWDSRLDYSAAASDLIGPLPAGTLGVRPAMAP
jgi:putative SOS response-associated peptidase YedK